MQIPRARSTGAQISYSPGLNNRIIDIRTKLGLNQLVSDRKKHKTLA